ncbi:hypothetical protein [Methylomicrobium lacus]|uniref:hypothetical protein n=1 Tax=Methylomicrobium lacus TaxID=136992 RepID=UPI0035A85508
MQTGASAPDFALDFSTGCKAVRRGGSCFLAGLILSVRLHTFKQKYFYMLLILNYKMLILNRLNNSGAIRQDGMADAKCGRLFSAYPQSYPQKLWISAIAFLQSRISADFRKTGEGLPALSAGAGVNPFRFECPRRNY